MSCGSPALGDEAGTAFRRAERYWKSKTCPPDPSEAFSPESVTSWPSDGLALWKTHPIRRLPLSRPSRACPRCHAEVGAGDGFAYAFVDQPGVFLLPSFICRHLQASLAGECFEEATGPSHRTNLDALYLRDRARGKEGVYGTWERWRRRRSEAEEGFVLRARDEAGEDVHVEEVWGRGKMRWSVLGRQYDWSTKRYDWEAPASRMPTLLVSLCQAAVASLPRDVCDGTGYAPDAAIVNFYQTRHTLTAHRDEAEQSPTAPLVSISLGHSAAFLVSPSKSLVPLPLMLRSGDVVVMSGERGRASWHGVPKVFSGERHRPAWLEDQGEGEGWREWLRKGGRVNANVRQVFDAMQMQQDTT